MSLGPQESTPSSPPTMEPYQPSPEHLSPPMEAIEPVRGTSEKLVFWEQVQPSKRGKSPVEHIRPSKRFKSCPVDSVHPPPPMDDIELIRKKLEKLVLVEKIQPSKRIKSFVSKNPEHHGSTPSSVHHRSTSFSPPTMEPSQPFPADSGSPVDAIQSIREIYDKIDLVEEVGSSKSESMNPASDGSNPSSSPTMEPCQHSSVDAVSLPPPMDAIESIREMYKKIDLDEHIDPLMRFVENQLHKMNTRSEAGSSSSDGCLSTVGYSTKLAATIIDTISTEAEKLSISDAIKAVENLMLKVMQGLGDLHLVFIGLSVAAFVVESITSVGSTENDLLLRILELAKVVKHYRERMPDDMEELCKATGTIVQGAVLCCDYFKRRSFFRFWSATTAAVQLEKTIKQLRDMRNSLQLLDLQSLWDKDVFLSHSGKQKNFVRQLHLDLTREHVSCFFDDDNNSLPLGEKFPRLIFKAAETCKIAVLLLSKDFILSKWPMLELSTFITTKNSGKNTNLKLLPIFFQISPDELSHITNDSPEWKKLEESYDKSGKWKDALKEVRSINGLKFSEDGNEVRFREQIVKEVCGLLETINRESPHQLLDFQPVGIEEQVSQVKALLDIDGAQSALAVIICGLGGVGKTTLAASVVQSLDRSSRGFRFCMVAIDEKALDKKSHTIMLQKYIISKLGGVKIDFQDPLEGRSKIKEHLKQKSTLLFIDNVVDKDYIRDLLPQDLLSDDQETKLRIIITSREKRVKAELNIKCQEYEVNGLSDVDSRSLLFQTIVQSQMVEVIDLNEEKLMIHEVAAACRGIPLLLSVFGKHLRVERSKDSYHEVLDVLRKGNLDGYRDEDLGLTLMFVYDKIKNEEVKEAFLDICMYFHDWEWDLVADIVDIHTLKDLQRRMLVSKTVTGKVIVHDILRVMGMQKAEPTRFSNWEKLSEALEDNLDGLRNVKGIRLVGDEHLITIPSSKLEAMHTSLRVLMLGDWVTLDGSPCQRAFKNLRYLCVGDINAFPFKDPCKLDKLQVFLNSSNAGMNLPNLPSCLKRISHEVPDVECDEFGKFPFQNLSSLKRFFVKTGNSKVKLPEELHLPPSLEYLTLSRCKNVPEDIGHLTALESLILDGSDLKCAPRGIGELKKLKHLSMNYCYELAFLSEELGMLSSLESLSMKSYINVRALPSLGGLTSLQKLELNGFSDLQLLPESLGELRIEKLKLSFLSNLQELPNSFGNMPFLKDLSLEYCYSLMSLPDSFVQLKMIETLSIYMCSKLSTLPEDFGQLRCLKDMDVTHCHLLKELPHGFGALPSLKTLKLIGSKTFANFPSDFTELRSLEELHLGKLPLISGIPDGFGKLKRLRDLSLRDFPKLKTLSGDFEHMASLERLWIQNCSELGGAVMEKILKLQHCYIVHIHGSTKLLEKWKHMQSKIEHPIAVLTGGFQAETKEMGRVIRVALLHGKCMEVNNATHQLMERSSLFLGLEKGISAMVALIMLSIEMQSDQQQIIQQFVEMAREAAETNGSDKLQIVCARKYVCRSTPTEEEERAEEEGIRQILLTLPKGSCAIPSFESKRLKIITSCSLRKDIRNVWVTESRLNKLSFFMANVGVDVEGRIFFENLQFKEESQISANVGDGSVTRWEEKRKIENSIKIFINSISPQYGGQSQSPCVPKENKTREFVEALKGNGIYYLLSGNNTNQVMVDDLHGKVVGFIICDIKCVEGKKLQQIYKDLQQQDSDFIMIWIPADWPTGCGHRSYTRLIQCMPWAVLPQFCRVRRTDPYFLVLDKGGQIANQDALSFLLGWGVKTYPFTQHSIRESFLSMESDSWLEFLLHGMNIVGRKPMKTKMTFLYAAYPGTSHTKNLEQLNEIHGNFEILYVGNVTRWSIDDEYLQNLKQHYEDETKTMRWPSLSFSDMIVFWRRCEYLAKASKEAYDLIKEYDIMMKTLNGLRLRLDRFQVSSLVVVDNEGAVICQGENVVKMICKSTDEISDGQTMRMVKDDLMDSLTRGKCGPLVKTFFRDEIDNHPQHPQHRISISLRKYDGHEGICSCGKFVRWKGKNRSWSYFCPECSWVMCGSCGIAYAKQQVEQLLSAKSD